MSKDILEKRKKKLVGWWEGWWSNNYNKIFLAIFIFAIILRFYFFLQTLDQAIWWDAGDYLNHAKRIAGKFSFYYPFNPRRPFLLALIWAFLMKIGFNEVALRFTEFLFSIAAIPAMYLIGKKMYNEKVGLISSFLLTIFWQHLFFSCRLMTEIPTLTLFLFSVYFFWRYIEEDKAKMLWLFSLFLGLAFLARAGTLVMFAVFPLFVFIKDKFKIFLNKKLWLSAFLIFLVMSSFFIFIFFTEHVNPITRFLCISKSWCKDVETGKTRETRFEHIMGPEGILEYIKFMPAYFGWILLLFFSIGIIIHFLNLILGLDLIFKNNKNMLKEVFLLLWWFIPFIYHAIFVWMMSPRYIIMSFPPFFILTSRALLQVGKWLKKYEKSIALIIIILVLILGAYYQIKQANTMIELKKISYKEIKDSGLWLKQNSNPQDIIISMSKPQHTYYAERKVYQPERNLTDFEKQIKKIKPTYLVLSIFEKHPSWLYTYPQEHNQTLIPVKAYYQNNQPILVIYRFNYTNTTLMQKNS